MCMPFLSISTHPYPLTTKKNMLMTRRCRSSFRLKVFIWQLRISVPFPARVTPRCMPWATLQTTWPLRTTATWAPTSCFLDLRVVESEDLGAFFLILGYIPIGSMYGIFTYYIWLMFMVGVGKYTIHGSNVCADQLKTRWQTSTTTCENHSVCILIKVYVLHSNR